MKDTLYQSVIRLDQENINHKRTTYNLLDLLSDLGGVTEVFMMVIGFFLVPIAEHSFMINAVKGTYLAKTRQENLFEEKDRYHDFQCHKKYVGNDPTQIPDDIKQRLDEHKDIHISFCTNLNLFCTNLFCCKCCGRK